MGNYMMDWGVPGSQERIMSIAQTSEFLREAMSLAAEFKDLENKIFSSGTMTLLARVLPRDYMEQIYEQVGSV